MLAGYLYLIGAVLAWSSLPVMTRLAYDLGFTPMWLGFLRFGLALMVLLPACLIRGRTSLVNLTRDRALLVSVIGQGLVFTAAAVTAFYALDMMAASLATILLYLAPALTCVLAAVFLKEKMTRGRLVALVVTLAGVAAVLGPRGPARMPLAGAGLAILSALLSATHFLLGQKNTAVVHPLVLATVTVGVSATAFSAAHRLWARCVTPMSTPMLLVALGVAVLPTVLGTVLDLLGIRAIGAARASIVTTLEPPIALGLARVVLGDRLLPLQALGAVLVTAGVLVLGLEDYFGRRTRRTEGPPPR